MKFGHLWRSIPLTLFLLQLFGLFAYGIDGEVVSTEIVGNHGQPTDSSSITATGGRGTSWQDDAGSIEASRAVESALRILRSLEPSDRLAKYEKPSGIFGYTVLYAKQAFYLLFMNGPPAEGHSSQKPSRTLSQPLSKAVRLLEDAANNRSSDAIYLLAEMNFYGNYTLPRNYSEAFRRYHELSSLTGNSSAQHMLGFMYATGIGEAVERDQAKALLYHTFAADGGNIRSEMTNAFRHHTGIATPKNCDDAARYYKRVADKVIAYARSGPPGGRSIYAEAYRWADEEGGVYGEGASVSSSGIHANRGGPNSHGNVDDVLEYLDLLSRKGDLKATFSLGELFYEGSRALKRNTRVSMRYFMTVARKYWGKDGKVSVNRPPGIEKLASKAAAFIGRIYLRGEGVDQNFDKALTWFKRGLANGDPLCQHHIGLMYLYGYGVTKDPVKAATYFKAASEDDLAASQNRLGALFLDQGDIQLAVRYFELAARHGHMEAFYYLAEIANQGVGRERHCGVATAYYKIVVEKAEALHSPFISEGNEAFKNGDLETALVYAMMAAEQGYENAQSNVAYLLDELFAGTDPRLTWKKTLPWLAKHTKLPIVLKGIQTHEDAYLAAQHTPQVKGIILSNHGGRALDTAPPAVHTLLEIRRYCPEVFSRLDVLVDGGIKRGTDVAKALCLGAKGVGIGRPALFGLGAGGAEGVARVLEILNDETKTAMRLLGVQRVEELGLKHVNTKAVDSQIYDGPAGLEKLGLWVQSKL